MPPAKTTQTQDSQSDRVARVGGWLFRQRTWLPLPIIALLLVTPHPAPSLAVLLAGVATVATGEAIRIWAVRNIGTISRTRSDRLGPLVMTGPFGLVRNPLYIGNLLVWIGFAISAGLLWFVPVIVLVLGAEYHAIVRWEEGLLEERLGDAYRAYTAMVGRWLPLSRKAQGASRESVASHKSVASRKAPDPDTQPFSWRETFFSERGTIVAIVSGYLLLWLKFTS